MMNRRRKSRGWEGLILFINLIYFRCDLMTFFSVIAKTLKYPRQFDPVRDEKREPAMPYQLEDQILDLHKDQDWTRILKILIENHENVVRRKFLWIVPELGDISWIKDEVVEKSLKGIVSIGCGCGLLERIIRENSGLEIIGVEVDRKWWQSVYSPPAFIPNIIFADESKGRICLPDLNNYALLFCYFNNERAFLNYMDEYEGELVIVIGPAKGQNRHTNPLPFDHKFADLGWRLYGTRELKHGSDLICVYVRFRKK